MSTYVPNKFKIAFPWNNRYGFAAFETLSNGNQCLKDLKRYCGYPCYGRTPLDWWFAVLDRVHIDAETLYAMHADNGDETLRILNVQDFVAYYRTLNFEQKSCLPYGFRALDSADFEWTYERVCKLAQINTLAAYQAFETMPMEAKDQLAQLVGSPKTKTDVARFVQQYRELRPSRRLRFPIGLQMLVNKELNYDNINVEDLLRLAAIDSA